MKKLFFFFISVSALILSCKKDKEIENIPPQTLTQSYGKVTEWYPLSVGSYWVYYDYIIDTNQNEQYFRTDTVKIIGDTNINSRTFTWIKEQYFGGPSYYNRFVADSLDYIIAENGEVLFSNTNFTDTIRTLFYPGLETIYYKMSDRGTIASVAAGVFPTIDRDEITVYDHPFTFGGNPRIVQRNFAKGIGIVKDRNFFDGNPNYMERRLVQYHIAQ